MARLRWLAAALAIASYAFVARYFVAKPFGDAPAESLRVARDIVHQTAIIAFAVWMRPLGLPPLAEGLLLGLLTALACIATYELARRIAPLRPLFGLKPAPSASASG